MSDKSIPERDCMKDSKCFDTVSDMYDLYRPAYPLELIESILSLTNIPLTGQILEIGSGTGKATTLFAQKGFSIHCIEPGKNLNKVAMRKLQHFPRVSFEQVRFEDWQEDSNQFDLVISASAFHWVDPKIGYRKAANALKTNGHIALFWNMYVGINGPLENDIERIYLDRVPELAQQREVTEKLIKQREEAILSSGFFSSININRFPWSERYDCMQYIGLLNTYSDHLSLPEPTRTSLLNDISEVIKNNGGYVDKSYLTVLYVAQKVAQQVARPCQ
jgi:SAM-dependent methyltransferase